MGHDFAFLKALHFDCRQGAKANRLLRYVYLGWIRAGSRLLGLPVLGGTRDSRVWPLWADPPRSLIG